jgi:AAA+ superfamily predicted ATPase
VDEDIQYLCDPYRLHRFSGKEALLVGFEPTTLTSRVNALATELQIPYFSMYSYSI